MAASLVSSLTVDALQLLDKLYRCFSKGPEDGLQEVSVASAAGAMARQSL